MILKGLVFEFWWHCFASVVNYFTPTIYSRFLGDDNLQAMSIVFWGFFKQFEKLDCCSDSSTNVRLYLFSLYV